MPLNEESPEIHIANIVVNYFEENEFPPERSFSTLMAIYFLLVRRLKLPPEEVDSFLDHVKFVYRKKYGDNSD